MPPGHRRDCWSAPSVSRLRRAWAHFTIGFARPDRRYCRHPEPRARPSMKTVRDWLNEYSVSHQNPVNKTVHWICVPVITFTVLGLLRAVPAGNDLVNACTLGSLLALGYYASLSWRLTVGMVGAFAVLYWLVQASFYGL